MKVSEEEEKTSYSEENIQQVTEDGLGKIQRENEGRLLRKRRKNKKVKGED